VRAIAAALAYVGDEDEVLRSAAVKAMPLLVINPKLNPKTLK